MASPGGSGWGRGVTSCPPAAKTGGSAPAKAPSFCCTQRARYWFRTAWLGTRPARGVETGVGVGRGVGAREVGVGVLDPDTATIDSRVTPSTGGAGDH